MPTMEKTMATLVQTLANESKTSGSSDMIEIMKIFASSTQSSNQSSLKIQEYQLQLQVQDKDIEILKLRKEIQNQEKL